MEEQNVNIRQPERKLLIIVENLPVPFDTRVWQEAVTLREHGYTVSVICPTGKGYTKEREDLSGVHIFRYPMPEEGNGALSYAKEYLLSLLREYRLAKKVYREIGFDVIQGCNPPDNIFLIARRFRKYGVRYVFDHHDVCPELYEAKFGRSSGLFYRLLCLFERLTYRTACFAFVTNESYREVAVSRGGMDPSRVMILRSGPRLQRLQIQAPEPQLKEGYPYMVGYLGVIGQQEGIEYLLQCADRIHRGADDVLWAIVGGGPHLEAVRKQAEDMGLGGCVRFTGRVPDREMLAYMNTADVCVNSDVWNRMNDMSTMNKVLEYMALGKPIVQFDLREGRVSAGGASLYARPNDAEDMEAKIRLLLDDPLLRKTMGEEGRRRILEELSWEHTGKALLEGYELVFGER